MGRDIEVTDFSSADYEKFSDRLYDCLSALKTAIAAPGFGEGPITLGAELESYIVDDKGDVAPINDRILSHMNDNRFQHELNKFNLEYNLSPVAAKGCPFSKMQQEIETALAEAAQAAALYNARIVPIGILPTLSLDNLQADYMTDVGRYHMLYRGLHQLRGEAFKININGDDPIQLESDLVTLEGANTSFQIHLRIAPDDFARSFNAAQMVTPLAVALSANSPILLGHRLWQETRVALFKQSIDSRLRGNVEWRQPSRVSFGHGWVRQDAHELFAETVALYPPIIPVLSPEDPLRFEIKKNVTISYAETEITQSDITLLSDIEKHNSGITPENEFLGWVGPGGLDYFSAIDDRGCDIKDELFSVQDHKLYTALPLRLFMVTPRPEIARKDCLFYLVRADA